MRPTMTLKSSRVSKNGAKRVRVVMEAEIGARNVADGPLAPHGFESVRRSTGSVRIPPTAHRVTPSRKYTASELASARAMMLKLQRGEDLRLDKADAVREALAQEDYDCAIKIEIAVERILDELEA